ncbi:MAG TPA: GNAT family N-acetyltransferase [Sphingopyxis sp.]|uniref:GNAT family N-acetyltransferase n=1 Tax=Sphingopyxis sp. TaxID=1908224 RepID=UPI002BDD09C0|nr:GNAT family N-acetyltransferase [Sphingopyxis sp.]HWW55533.1 GNAT family N-acetyltransferase [Sphingopyxis sp.]
MPNPTSDDQLRAMAEHRGLKLVRSRKRTPGVGDYGKYGLTDTAGKPLLGMGDAGLTASAKEIEDYLRGSALSTWKLSAETTPDAAPPKKKPAPAEDAETEAEGGPVRRKAKARAAPPARAEPRAKADPSPPMKPTRPPAKPALRLVPKAEPEPLPPLKLRPAATSDTPALAALLGQLAGPKTPAARITANLGQLQKTRGAGFIVAERGEVVGCCGWTVVPTLQHGALGRITLLLVDKDHRRTGTGSALLAAAERALEQAGCSEIEAMSDIMIANAHNFFRSLGFEQKSYRFVRRLGT